VTQEITSSGFHSLSIHISKDAGVRIPLYSHTFCSVSMCIFASVLSVVDLEAESTVMWIFCGAGGGVAQNSIIERLMSLKDGAVG
jgi:hypothetical protein